MSKGVCKAAAVNVILKPAKKSYLLLGPGTKLESCTNLCRSCMFSHGCGCHSSHLTLLTFDLLFQTAGTPGEHVSHSSDVKNMHNLTEKSECGVKLSFT